MEPDCIVTVVAVIPVGHDARTLIYKLPIGGMRERLLNRPEESTIALATTERPWSFDGDGALFQLTTEALRVDLAFLFDPMMAVHSSTVDPLPHQITAVYESMLPRQPLRFVLADDPGAGKTIMAGLYIRELLLRGDSRRILVVAPGSLVEQWQAELWEKFGLEFKVFTKEMESVSTSGNPFEDHPQLIVRLDQLSRSDENQDKACRAGWDLVVFDEAHKLSAHFYGQEIKKTRRFELAEKLGAHTRHLLLMTATPHNGKEEDFQLFLSLLDSDRFYGRFRDGVHKIDPSDLMRRMVKEDLLKFDGTRLFPERRAYTVNYELSPDELDLYERVTHYVKTEMGKAEKLDGRQRGSVGFALTTLQRRLASSPEAIYQSLKRRGERLLKRVEEARLLSPGRNVLEPAVFQAVPEDEDEFDASEQEETEESLVEEASAARSIGDLEAERLIVKGLEVIAQRLVSSDRDRKWEELSRILQQDPLLHDADGRLRKIIIFSEHRDTLHYLTRKVSGVIGDSNAVVTIHGGTPRDLRLDIQARFRSDADVRVLIATDAAGEGVNLQTANLMVNYDLPWNPNRLEQRFGRIHRIGQDQTCHLWNLVAKETREGDVYFRLLEKLRVVSAALNGRVFDILGDVFEGVSLRDLLIQAIRAGDSAETKAWLHTRVDSALDLAHIQAILDRSALAQETMSAERLFAVKEEMDKAEARKLQPLFVQAFFQRTFQVLKGALQPREAGRLEVTYVPASLIERDRVLRGRNRRDTTPVQKKYERICFTKDGVRPASRKELSAAVLMHPGHPLMLAMTDMMLEQNRNLMRQGTILVDATDDGDEPNLLLILTHEITSGDGQVLSKRLQFVRVAPDGQANFAGWAPHLDLEVLPSEQRPLLASLLEEPWISGDQEGRALALAAATLVPEHVAEVATRRIAHVDKTLAAVHERLTKEINYWSDRFIKLSEDRAAGKDVRVTLQNVQRTIDTLETRLASRRKELMAMRHVASSTPVALGGALVIPAGLLRRLAAEAAGQVPIFAADPTARSRTERLAMNAVRHAEEARGCLVVDVSAQKCGWDLTAYPPAQPGQPSMPRHIEVKGRVKGAETLTVTSGEIRYALNQADKFVLAIVLVGDADDEVDGPYYVRKPFDKEPGWGVASWNIQIATLLSRAEYVGLAA